MYHALLTNRYLTTRVIPLVAVGAVGLCVALVIIVVSVMTGFLNMVRDSGRTLMGDVVVSYQISGIPHYEKLIEKIEAQPEAAAASPVVDSWGLLRMPYPDGDSKDIKTVQIWGIEPESFARVTGFETTLEWKTLNNIQRELLTQDLINNHAAKIEAMLDDAQRRDLLKSFSRNRAIDPQQLTQIMDRMPTEQWVDVIRDMAFDPEALEKIFTKDQWTTILNFDPRLTNNNQLLEDGRALQRLGTGTTKPGIVPGIHISIANIRKRDGTYEAARGWDWWLPRYSLTLTTIPVVAGGFVEPETIELQVVNEFQSGVYLIDQTRAMIPLAIAQELLHLDEAKRVDPDDPDKIIGIDPARVTMVLVRAADGITPEKLQIAVNRAYDEFADEFWDDPDALVKPPLRMTPFTPGASIQTWSEQQAQFIGPIEKERELMRTLFSIVYLVCAGLVLAIFWAIVYEKTRDIGVLRSIGASRLGISWIFLRYGLVVGIFGSLLGLGIGFLIVHNINSIHDALGNPPKWLGISTFVLAIVSLVLTILRSLSGRLLPLVLGSILTLTLLLMASGMVYLSRIGGIIVWNPEVYYFTKIPNEVDMEAAITTMIGAVIFSLIGAFLPAAKAADIDPVKALRYE